MFRVVLFSQSGSYSYDARSITEETDSRVGFITDAGLKVRSNCTYVIETKKPVAEVAEVAEVDGTVQTLIPLG